MHNTPQRILQLKDSIDVIFPADTVFNGHIPKRIYIRMAITMDHSVWTDTYIYVWVLIMNNNVYFKSPLF